jgi:hypothetical protein
MTGYPNTKTVTAKGNAHISTAQSVFGGASGLFGGTGDYLSIPDSADWAFGAGDFTIDFWVRYNGAKGRSGLFEQYQDGSNFQAMYADATYIYYGVKSGGSWVFYKYFPNPIRADTWAHIAVVRSASAWSIYVNGVAQLTWAGGSSSISDYNGAFTCAYEKANSWYFNGWMDEVRVSKGIARWTSNFTPPTAPYDRDGSVVLLLHMDGADGSTTFIDG